MATEFGIRIKADSSGFKGQVGEARREVEEFGRGADEASVALASKLGVAVGAAAVAVGGVFVNEVRKAISALDDLDETAQALGVASMQISARAAGVESGQLTSALTRLNAQIADAGAGNARSTALFRSMGIEVRTATGELKTADVVLGEIAEKFRGYQDGAAKSNLATDIFGRGAAKMTTYLNEGREGLEKFGGASKDQIEQAAKLAGEIDKLSASWERLKLVVGGTVAGGINSAIAAVGSESENAADKVLERLERSMARVRGELGGRMNDEVRAAAEAELADMERRAEALRSQVARARRELLYGNTGYGDTRPEAPNSGGTPRERSGRSGLTEAQREEIALQRELQQIRSQGYQAALREEQARARELTQLEEQNQAIRNQIEEFGKSELQVAELRAARLEDAAAMKEQRLAQLELVDGAEAEIVQLRAQIALLRERARLTRLAGRQVQDERDADDANNAAAAAARKASEENERMTDELRRGLTDALMRGFEGGKDAAKNFFDTVANMIQTMILRRLAEGFINQVFNAVGAAYSGSSGYGYDSSGMGRGGGESLYPQSSGQVVRSSVPKIGADAMRISGAAIRAEPTGAGGAGKVTVNVINKTGAQVRTEERSDGGGLSIDVIVEQVEDRLAGNVSRGRGSLGSALEGKYALRPQPR